MSNVIQNEKEPVSNDDISTFFTQVVKALNPNAINEVLYQCARRNTDMITQVKPFVK